MSSATSSSSSECQGFSRSAETDNLQCVLGLPPLTDKNDQLNQWWSPKTHNKSEILPAM